MRYSKLNQIIFSTFFVFGLSAPSDACEKHNGQAIESSSLPGNSLYHINSKWINQDNSTVHLNEFAGKPRLIAMVYTKCTTACPLLVRDIKSMTSKIPKALADKINIDLFSFDSESENSKSLQSFKEKYKLGESWSAYSGSKGSVSELAAALGIQYKKLPSGDYIHSNVVFFINENGEVVAKHEGLGRDVSEFIKKIENAL